MASDGSGASRGQVGGANGGLNGPGGVVVETRDKYSVFCSWKVAGYAKIRQRAIWSNYFEVGGYDCRLLIYPGGDSQAVPGYVSVYLQLTDPRHSGGKWECFCSYQLSVLNHKDVSKSVSRDSWHRYSAKKKSHGWCDFAPACTITDTHQGFMLSDTIVITADITVLHETSKFSRDDDASQLRSSYVMSGTFNWRVHNFSLFMDMIKTQKIMSPTFPAGDCCLQMSVYQLTVEGTEYLSLCLESKDPDKSEVGERTCWSLFRISVLNQNGKQHRHRDSYGRFTADSESGDNTSLGWNEYMKMPEFTDEALGFLVDNTAVFQVTYHVLMEQSSFSRILDRVGSTNHVAKRKGANHGGDHYQGKFVWKIENFTRLKEMLRKRKITGLCIKSRRFQVGGKDCRLIVYPRGQSQPPSSLSMFLEVTKRGTVDDTWSCFVSHRLSVLSQSTKSGVDRTVVKESQNRYSKTAKDWGWREFISLTSLFDQELGFLVSDGISFQAEVLVLKEVFEKRDTLALPGSLSKVNNQDQSVGFLWRMDNFSGFREVMETRKIYSQYFRVGDCSLRIGMYDSFDMLCVYLESENSGSDPDDSFWVRFRIAVINQKHPSLTHWKESSLCTRTWSNSVLQLLKVSQLIDPKAGYLQREGIQVACDVIECSSWFEFGDSDLTVWEEVSSTEDMGSSSSKRTALTTVNDVSDDESSESNSKSDVEEMFQCVFSGRQGDGGTIPDLDTSMLRASCSKFVGDAGAVSSFIAGLRHCLSDPAKVQRLVMPAQGGTSSNLLELLLNIRGLASPLIDMLLDIMVECALSIGSCATEQVKQDSSSGAEDLKECTSSTSESNVEEDQVSRDPPSGTSTPMMHIPSFLGPAMNCLNGKSSLTACGRDVSSSTSELGGVQRSDDLQHISPMIRFGTFAPGAVPGMDKNPRSRKAESRAWRVLGKLGSEQALTAEASTTGDPPVSSATLMVPPTGNRACLASEDSKNRMAIPNPPAGSGSSCVPPSNHKESRSNQLRKKARPTGTGGSESPGKLPSGERRVMHAEVLTLLVGALTSADFDHDDDDGSEAGSNEDEALDGATSQHCASSNLHKISLLLSSLPVSVLPDVIMLVPMLLRPSEHTAVAGFLLGWLSELGRQNPDIEQLVRPAVLSSLGPLKISDAIANKVVEAALKALAVCPTAEIPAAVVLILKLSSEHVGSGGAGINGGLRGVRDFLKHNVDGISENIFVAVQLAVMRHSQICDALHADIRLECEQMCSQSQPSGSDLSISSPNPRSLVDTMVLMDMLRTGEKRDDVLSTLQRCISLGLISSADISTVLDRRRMYHKFWRDMDQLPTPDSTAPDSSWVSEGSTGSEEEAHSDMPISNDEFQSILDLSCHLLQFKDAKVNKFLSDLYNFLFEVICDFPLHEQLLQSLISQTSMSGNSNQEGALEILLGIVQRYPFCATRTISLLVSDIGTQAKDYKAVKQKAASLEQDKKKLEVRLKELSNKTNTDRKELRSRIAELEKKLTKACQSKQENLKRILSEKSELQEKVRGLEGQVEWIQAERNEEQARATECASAVQDLQRQLCESESQVGQLKKQRRDDQRLHTREKNTLSEKLSSLEADKQQSDELISELKIRVAQSSAEVAQRDKKLNDLENSVAKSAKEMEEIRATNDKQSTELRERLEYSTKIAEELQSKTEQCSRLRGTGLEKMDVGDLQELIAIQEQSIRAATDILQQRGVAPPTTPSHDPSHPAPMLGLVMSSEADSQVLPMSQERWPTTFRNESDHQTSMFRSHNDAPGFTRERLAPFPGVPPRGPDLGGSIPNVSYHQNHPKMNFGSGLSETSSMGRLMRGASEYGGSMFHPRPPLDDNYVGFHMPKPPHYDAHPHESIPGAFIYQNRPHMGPWQANQDPGLVADPSVGGQPQIVAQPLRNGYVNGLFGSGSLTSGKKIW